MNKNSKKIMKVLPKGLSKEGLNEIATLLDQIVEERVSEEVTTIEAKVKGFLRTKIDEMKSVAMSELEAENSMVANAQMYETIRAVVAADLQQGDENSIVNHLEAEASKLQESLNTVNGKLAKSLKNNSLLENQASNRESQISELSSLLEEEKNKLETPFRSSESAVVITNEKQHSTPTRPDNGFLTEDVIRLAQPLQEYK